MRHEDLSSGTAAAMSASTSAKSGWYPTYVKRALDLAISIALLPFVVPAIAVFYVLTLRDGGPGLFGHVRIGQHGKPFKCLKIRTMVPDAEARLSEYLSENPEAAAEWANMQKLSNDPRITSLGKFLRKTSLDELPQIWNVLRGDMSLVGPRPVTEPELERYGPHQRVYLNLKPGITGLWQVEGRSNGCYDERLLMDRSYAANIHIGRDLLLMWQTAFVVVKPTGR